ncbi:hypothetical protein KH5_01040 [Urechidicola sp. KH5]
MKRLILVGFLITVTSSFAQFHKSYNWEENRSLHQVDADKLQSSSLTVLRKTIVEYRPSAMSQGVDFFETTHNIVRVNDEAGVAQQTQIYIPMYRVKEIIDLKARTINKDGKITLLDEKNIKKVENVEEYGDFQIFAIEGVEIGSEIELLYTLHKEYSPFGYEFLQSDAPIERVEVVFIKNSLNGQIKTYNTDQEFERTYLGNMLVEELFIDDVPAMVEEEYAGVDANKIYVAYQCFGSASVTQDLLWGNTTGNIASGYFTPTVMDEVKNLIPEIIQEDNLDTFTQAALVDNYIKTNFAVIENNNPNLEELDYIIKNKAASQYSIGKVYMQFLMALDIPFELVVTASRYDLRFDPEFYNPNSLRDFLIYLPSIKKYISPERLDYRLGEAPALFLGNNALFINQKGEFYFDVIKQNDPDFSQVKRIMDISFPDDFDRVRVDEKQEYTGHWSILYRAIMAYYSEEMLIDVKDQLTGSGIDDKNTISFEEENKDMNQSEYNIPYKVNSVIETPALLEDAGGMYIFEIGKTIGIQSELYQETERRFPVEMQYPNEYFYTITIDIPEGYIVEGTESLVLNKQLKVEEEVLCQFVSNFEIKDNKLIISINEFYHVNEYPKELYEGFREVINAASDFNKASILFTVK